jgi:arylsulfatase A-like enzyme
MIAIDTLRANHLGFMGYERDTSPFLDELAARSVVFDNIYTPKSLTHPSFTAMFSGLHPIHNKIYENMWPIAEDLHMLPEDFQAAGFRTVFLSASGIIHSRYRMNKGFDEYIDADPHPEEAWHMIEKARAQTEDLSKPLFLCVHFWEPHSPYDPPPEYLAMFADPNYEGPMDGSVDVLNAYTLWQIELLSTDVQHAVDRYDGEIRGLDDQLRSLFDYFEEKGLMDNSIIIVTADHGESLGEDHIFQHCYDTNIELQIPLILHFPGDVDAGLRIPQLAENTDILPTVMDILGIRIPEGIDGISMFPLFNHPELVHRAKLLSVGVDDPGYFQYSEFDGTRRVRVEAPVEDPEPVWLDEQDRERLRALGYIH